MFCCSDASDNRLHGTIPSSFGSSSSIKDFRMANNMLYDPIPSTLCSNTNLNGGATLKYGCAGVLCPLGSYTENGHAMDAHSGCIPCPPGETTMYLGSSSCRAFSEKDILSLLFDVLQGERWPPRHKENWRDYKVSVCDWAGGKYFGGHVRSHRCPLTQSLSFQHAQLYATLMGLHKALDFR
jgi:hypothetical protein